MQFPRSILTPAPSSADNLNQSINGASCDAYNTTTLFTAQRLYQDSDSDISIMSLPSHTSSIAALQASLPALISGTERDETNVSLQPPQPFTFTLPLPPPSAPAQDDTTRGKIHGTQTERAQCFGSNIYVASLPESCTDADLLRLFSPFGPIVSAKVMCHKGTTRCKGYGFVLFEREEDASKAQSAMIGHIVGGNKIQVRRARMAASTPLFGGSNCSGSSNSLQKLSLSSASMSGSGVDQFQASNPPLQPTCIPLNATAMLPSSTYILPPGPTTSPQTVPSFFPYLPGAPTATATPVYWPGSTTSGRPEGTQVVYMMVPVQQGGALSMPPF